MAFQWPMAYGNDHSALQALQDTTAELITRDTRGSLMGAVSPPFFFPFFYFVKRGNWPLDMDLLYLNMTSAFDHPRNVPQYCICSPSE